MSLQSSSLEVFKIRSGMSLQIVDLAENFYVVKGELYGGELAGLGHGALSRCVLVRKHS